MKHNITDTMGSYIYKKRVNITRLKLAFVKLFRLIRFIINVFFAYAKMYT